MCEIAIFNGFPFHYEMFGYIIYFCYSNKFNLTIYTNFLNDNGWLKYYKYIFEENKKYVFTYKNISDFEKNKYLYDLIILPTDNDYKFNDNNYNINNKTIRIDHYYVIRRPKIEKFIATRPFLNNYRKWSLPCFPIQEIPKLLTSNIINITIVGSTISNYKVDIINRLESLDNKKIRIICISRKANTNDLKGIDSKFELKICKNINTLEMIDILIESNYILTDVSIGKNYISDNMSGIIPLSLSLLVPLIISKNTNKYYQFKNVIEFDENSNESIILKKVNIENLIEERNVMVNTFSNYMFEYMKDLQKI